MDSYLEDLKKAGLCKYPANGQTNYNEKVVGYFIKDFTELSQESRLLATLSLLAVQNNLRSENPNIKFVKKLLGVLQSDNSL